VSWTRDLDAAGPVEMSWLWHGLLAPGNLTLLTSPPKSGKTTLLAALLARLQTGGALLGLPVAAGKALVVSEEPAKLWHLRRQRFAFGDAICWLCRPFPGKPTAAQWQALLDRIGELHAQHRFDLVALDTLSALLPGHDESNAGTMIERLLPLQALAANGPSLFLAHHPSKRASAAGMAARGSGALTSVADIVLEMHWYRRGDEEDRRRRLYGWSRYDATPRQLVIELSAAGSDYLCHGPAAEDEYRQGWQVVYDVLAGALTKLTLKEIRQDWPPAGPPPSEISLYRWLERAVAQGQVCRDGTGRKSAPHRYWLPGQEKRWLAENPAYVFAEANREETQKFAQLAQVQLADCYRGLAEPVSAEEKANRPGRRTKRPPPEG
jgi:hypothetical protein